MRHALILRPTKSAMQSARLDREHWELRFCKPDRGTPHETMGWTTQQNTDKSLKLTFEKKADAIAYAEKNNITYTVQESDPAPPLDPHSYAEHLLKPHMRS